MGPRLSNLIDKTKHMTVVRALTPRNLLILLCTVALVLVGIKGIYIVRKINAVNQANAFYANKQLVEAEEWYAQAINNRWLHYKEDLLQSRQQELAPITNMKLQLIEISRMIHDAVVDEAFDPFMALYEKQQNIRSQYIGNKHPHEAYYRQLSAKYRVSDQINDGFMTFIQKLDEQMTSNLEQKQYQDETFIDNMMRIPALYYGGSDKQKLEQLSDKFKAYDERKFAQLGAAGSFSSVLQQAMLSLERYKKHQLEAPWISAAVHNVTSTLLEKDIERDDISTYIQHAKDYIAFADSVDLKSSLTKKIDKQISTWMKQAKRLADEGQYEAAISRYELLAAYRDMAAEIKAVQTAWMASDPVRMLQKVYPDQSFHHVIGGANRFGVKAYAIGVDSSNQLYYASWNGEDDNVKVLTSSPLPQQTTISSLTLHEQLSKKKPVLVIESASETRAATYTIVQINARDMDVQLQIEGDQLIIHNVNKLQVVNPNTERADGRTANYHLLLGKYLLLSYEALPNVPSQGPIDETDATAGYTEISVEQLPEHPNESVRFSCEIVVNAEGIVYGVMGSSFVQLNGDIQQQSGTITVAGTFSTYTDVLLDQQTISIPVFNVEMVE